MKGLLEVEQLLVMSTTPFYVTSTFQDHERSQLRKETSR